MASGDLTYEHQVTGTLTSPQRTSLGTLVAALWPGQLSNLNGVSFWRNEDGTVGYSLRGDHTVAPAALPLGVVVKARTP
jgi:hypothetical protein